MPEAREDGFAPLRAYALLGDLRAVALVAEDGAIDWLALPTIDTAPACAALLDPAHGGSITLAPTIPFEVSRRYLPGTMVLETRFTTGSGTMRVTDALTFGALGTLPWTELARIVEVDEGDVPLAWAVRPGHRLSTAARPWAHRHAGTPLLLSGDLQLAVVTDRLGEPNVEGDRVFGEELVRPGEPRLLAVVGAVAEPLLVPSADEIRRRVKHTIATWCDWSELVDTSGRWGDLVLRSALVLKALTLKSTGAIAAAATTSLPEKIGGKRNYDYRFAWIRDSAFALDALSRLGLTEELQAGVVWLLGAVAQDAPELRVFYDLHGRHVTAETDDVDDAPGYRGSRPVQVGNSAADQVQLGAYGDLMDAVEYHVQAGGQLPPDVGTLLAGMLDHVCDIWASRDSGLWELGSLKAYTSSKLGCWVALDRGARLAAAGQLPSLHVERWAHEREQIRRYINHECWSDAKRAYTFYAGTDELDAAVLLMARTGFVPHGDPRLSTTIDAILGELAIGSLVYRYSGQQDKEGAFLACSCWVTEALVHVGRVSEADQFFTEFAHHANDLGLFTEEIDPSTGELLGNLPQALTHLAVIGAATALTDALDGD